MSAIHVQSRIGTVSNRAADWIGTMAKAVVKQVGIHCATVPKVAHDTDGLIHLTIKFSEPPTSQPRKKGARISPANFKPHWMSRQVPTMERHRTGRMGWLRAAVLGANDGIVSTSSLLLGVAASHAAHGSVLVAGVAALVSGAMSMAAGEYVSVQSQKDSELADLDRERVELKTDTESEHRELASIYVSRGLDPSLAKQVAEQLMNHDALGAHARDELGISETLRARPMQAALASAASFSAGAAMPLLVTIMAPAGALPLFISGTSLLFLAVLGGLAARVGGAGVIKGTLRVTFWGAFAMALTAGVGALWGAVA
jgi:VIT1/CCC1 family predicted Fe2+/Mn2+ transporter